jgi:hypothetical protein
VVLLWKASLPRDIAQGLSEFAQIDIAEEDRSLRFVNEWLSAVADYVVGLFIVQVLRLRSLSGKGCFQMSADVTYIMCVNSHCNAFMFDNCVFCAET